MVKISNEIYGPYGQVISSDSGYGAAGASYKKRALKAFDAVSGNTITDIDVHNSTLRQRSRVLYMASPLAASGIKTNRTNVIGSGLRLRARIDAEALGLDSIKNSDIIEEKERQIEREFNLWASDKRACDITGVNDFYSMQQLILMSWQLSGDSIILKKYIDPTDLHPYGLRLHIIESDRVSTPPKSKTGSVNYNFVIMDGRPLNFNFNVTEGKADNGNTIHDGVEIDKNGAIVAYYVCSTNPNIAGFFNKPEWIRIPAYGEDTGLPLVYHVMDTERPEQYRGVPYLAQVIEPLLQLRRYTESELMAATVQSFFTAFITTESDPNFNPMNETGDSRFSDPNDYEMGPGTINTLLPGENVEFADPKRPATGFELFLKAMCSQIGSALEIPSELLLKQFTSSYSASRAALLEAWKAFRMRREWIISDFNEPVYEAWFAEAVDNGRIDAPGFFDNPLIRKAWTGSTWIGPSQGQIDPLKEVNAEIKKVEHGFSTNELSTTTLTSGSWNDNISQIRRENEKIALAQEPLKDEEE